MTKKPRQVLPDTICYNAAIAACKSCTLSAVFGLEPVSVDGSDGSESHQGLQWQPALDLLDNMESAKVAPNANSNVAESLEVSAIFFGGL